MEAPLRTYASKKHGAPLAEGEKTFPAKNNGYARACSKLLFHFRRTTMAALEQEERHESSIIEQLPVDILTRILGYMNIEKRVKLVGTRTNKTL